MPAPPIVSYFHCRQCVIQGLPSDIEAGLTSNGFRCDCRKHGLMRHFTPEELLSIITAKPPCDCCPGGVHLEQSVEGVVSAIRDHGRAQRKKKT